MHVLRVCIMYIYLQSDVRLHLSSACCQYLVKVLGEKQWVRDGADVATYVWAGAWGCISWPVDTPRSDAEAVSRSVASAARTRPSRAFSSECNWSLFGRLCLAESWQRWDSLAQVYLALLHFTSSMCSCSFFIPFCDWMHIWHFFSEKKFCKEVCNVCPWYKS